MGGVRKRGSNWSYYFNAGKKPDGSPNKIERVGGKTKKEALMALAKAEAEYNQSGSLIDESNITVGEYFDYWYEQYALINCKYNTQNAYRNVIDKHIKPTLGIYRLKAIKPNTLQEFLNSKYVNGMSKNTLRNFYGVLSGGFKYALYPCNFIKSNPMTHVNMPKIEEAPKGNEELKVIAMSDFKAIIERFPFGKSRFNIPLQIAFNTGLRAAEVCGLTWDNIDLENGTLTVEKILIGKGKGIWEFGTPKTQSSHRTIRIGKTLIDMLKKQRKYQLENQLKYGPYYHNSNFVCTEENGKPTTPDSLKYLSRIVNLELGIKFNFHSLRHTHATMLLERGANIKDIQKRLGHSRLATTMDTYSHVTEKIKNDTVNILEAALSEI